MLCVSVKYSFFKNTFLKTGTSLVSLNLRTPWYIIVKRGLK